MQQEPSKDDLQSEKNNMLGFSTDAALARLSEEIEQVICSYETKSNEESLLTKTRSLFTKPYENPIGWFPIVTTILTIIILCVIHHYFSALFLLAILTGTIALVVRENHLRRTEIFRKVRLILNEIRLARKLCKNWTPQNYPNPCCPVSPCVSLQWTYRDGHIVNLPWALLVRGDVIVIRPGQSAPAACVELHGRTKFKCGETYGLSQPLEPPLKPIARNPLPNLSCQLETTPFLNNLKTVLEKFLNRPTTIYNHQRYLLVTKYFQAWGVIVALIITLGVATIYHHKKIYYEEEYKWTDLFLERPVSAIIPILPLVFPLMWITINLWGIARLQTHLSQPHSHMKTEQHKSFQEDLDTPTFDFESTPLPLKQSFRNWLNLFRGYNMLLGRSSNIVQVLGSITALCCVDKKGILSWPNPTPEKVFFLRDSAETTSRAESESSIDSVNQTGNGDILSQKSKEQTSQVDKKDTAGVGVSTSPINNRKKGPEPQKTGSVFIPKQPGTIAEVLDLTHDQLSPFKIDFDDHGWKTYIDSLKPLGLAILVNTCCQKTQEHYAQFCAHVMAVATLDKDLVPVTNRYDIVDSNFLHGRCLCELAKQMGFTANAREIFQFEGQIASYMHLQPEVVKRDIRFARQLRIASKVKVPFPHCLSVVIRDLQSNSLQMLTQGTADIILDCCDDFWDGKDLRPLGIQERKRAQDFYQRNALTAYCTAFAYRPLRHGIAGALTESAYLELPPETKHQATGRDHFCTNDCALHPHNSSNTAAALQHSISSDSLLFSENNKEEEICDVDGCFEMQCHQIFIGMVTMQYQAQTDIVQLIERLERACIRFVHFSKENELRSRVFSEKMGLESGWNCHISLLSDDFSNLTSPKSLSHTFDQSAMSAADLNIEDDCAIGDSELHKLLPVPSGLESSKNLSSSAPGAISDELPKVGSDGGTGSPQSRKRRLSKDSAMEVENCRSISCLTESSEQSAPVNFDMSNRAKLPRGIQNIRPHLENVDNVPLLVSLFTDCSADATREMLSIMQAYGEIVVCIGSSASNANAEIFLQADCSIAIEPLYPQVCQEIPAYTESNILHNRLNLPLADRKGKNCYDYEPALFNNSTTISPIYLSRILNALPCSIAVCRDDSFSILAMIELSRRFSNGLWNCIQFWACCGCSLTILNIICAAFALPPILTPASLLYLMCIVVPLLSVTLVNTESDPQIMNRATGKKHTSFDSNAFAFILWCYGGKFLPTILIMVFSYYFIMSHSALLLDDQETISFINRLEISRCFILYAVVLHFAIISMNFVHRDCLICSKSPFSNRTWVTVCHVLIIFQSFILIYDLVANKAIFEQITTVWPIILLLFLSIVAVFGIVEFCKWQELKVNSRYQRRARLDFGTKLGMNSPF